MRLYREQRALVERIDATLSASGLEQDFINLALIERKIATVTTSAKILERFARYSVLALRSNIARRLTGLGHHDFRARIADSQILQWLLHVGEVDTIKVFSKSSSDRFGQWTSEESPRVINQNRQHLPEGKYTFPHRLGSVTGCRPHLDESHRAHPQTRIEEPDATRTARILE